MNMNHHHRVKRQVDVSTSPGHSVRDTENGQDQDGAPTTKGIKIKNWLCGAGDTLVENMTACVSHRQVYQSTALVNAPLEHQKNSIPLGKSSSQRNSPISSGYSMKKVIHSTTSRTVSATTSSGGEDDISDRNSEDTRTYTRKDTNKNYALDTGTVLPQSRSEGVQIITKDLAMQRGIHSELIGAHSNYRFDSMFVMDVINRLKTTISPWYHKCNGGEKPSCVFSEPCASNFKVRGKYYCADQVKTKSTASIMALLGADKFVRSNKSGSSDNYYHVSSRENSFLNRFRVHCREKNIDPPFLLIFNFILPWGNFLMYTQRPDGDGGGPFKLADNDVPSERAWRMFARGSKDFRERRLKLISSINAGPFLVKKMVGSNKPAIIGQKVSVSTFGSIDQNYLEICLDICKGSKLAHSITNAVCGHANQVTVDLAFTVEGSTAEGTLPERILTAIRLHHVSLKGKSSVTMEQFERELSFH